MCLSDVKAVIKEFTLYDSSHKVLVRDISGGFWIGYRTTASNQTQGTTHFDVNVIRGVFFILSIELDQEHRGKGHGAALYKLLEQMARRLNCHQVQMTPSGRTPSGESRESYLLRRGYEKFGAEVIKVIDQTC